MNKILIISGPTATGKTALALKIAKQFNGEIISADSRQIYKDMDIGTGKDHPNNVKINLIDLITPNQKFSVADFQKLALEKIKEIQSKNKLPILVGCSGFYIDSIINPSYKTFSIKPNKVLRYILNNFSIKILQKIYYFLDKNSFLKLNNSDKNNPYRIIRRIEIKLSFPKNKIENWSLKIENYLHLSLTAPSSFLYPRIDQRVEKRLKMGHLNEIKKLLKKYNWGSYGLQVSAYKSFHDYFKNKKSLEECIQKWKYLEHRDARRQKTWFKKQKNAIFLDINKSGFNKIAESLVKKWYNNL